MSYQITPEEIRQAAISSLSNTPNRGGTFGTNGLSAEALKARFDALGILIAKRFNELVQALEEGEFGGGGDVIVGAGLPPITEEDNGKVLQALNGVWTAILLDLPKSLSELVNDTGFINADGAPVQSVNGKKGAVSLLYEDVGADPSGTAYAEVSTHNTSDGSHSDIRLLLSALASRVNTALNSSDVDLDQLSEIVAYIKNNSSLIAGVTTSKVNVSDIIDNLSTNMASKPLSAAQGVALKSLIDTLDRTKLAASALTSAIETALAEAKASGEFDGKDGVGISNIEQTNSVGNGKVDIYTITLTNGDTYTFDVTNGTNGDPGKDGVGIAKIEQTGSDGANIDIYTITLTNGTTYTFTVENGAPGTPGKDGTSPTVAVSKSGKVTTITLTDKNGTKTATINDGADGSSVSVSNVSESTASGGSNVVTFSDGKKVTVKNGKDGKTPVKGTDYFTAADKAEIVSAVLSNFTDASEVAL